MALLNTGLFNPPDNNPRKCDRYKANKDALILIARANLLKQESPTPRSEELHRQTLDLAINERDFCIETRRCIYIEECRNKINKDLGIYDESK